MYGVDNLLGIFAFIAGISSACGILGAGAVYFLFKEYLFLQDELSEVCARTKKVELEIENEKRLAGLQTEISQTMKPGGYTPLYDPATKQTNYVHDDKVAEIGRMFGINETLADMVNDA